MSEASEHQKRQSLRERLGVNAEAIAAAEAQQKIENAELNTFFGTEIGKKIFKILENMGGSEQPLLATNQQGTDTFATAYNIGWFDRHRMLCRRLDPTVLAGLIATKAVSNA